MRYARKKVYEIRGTAEIREAVPRKGMDRDLAARMVSF